MKRKRLMIFGAGELQESLIKNAKEMGLYTVGIDPNSNAVAREFLDKFYVVDGEDYKKTCEIIELNKIDGIVTTATEKPLRMMTRIAENYGFIFPPLKAIKLSTDKYLMKKTFFSKGIPCAFGKQYNSIEEMENNLNKIVFPAIIKPVDSSGSRGVKLCNSIAELKGSFVEAASYSSSNKIIIEEYLEGSEISVEAIIRNNNLSIIQYTDKLVSQPPYNVEIGHIQPSTISMENKEEIKRILTLAVASLEFNNCGIHAELKITCDGPKVIEIGARLGGGFITSHLVPLSTGVNLEKAVCSIALGEKLDLEIKNNAASAVKYFLFKQGTVKQIKSLKNIKSNIHLDLLKFDLEVGSKITDFKNGLDRYGCIICSSDNRDAVIKICDELISIINDKIIIN